MKKFTKKQNEILSEIYRRLNYFHKGNLNEKLLLLSVPSQVKVIKKFELIKPYPDKETPNVRNWYCLTEKGRQFFSNYVTELKISSSLNLALFTREYVKSFDKSLLT